MFLNIKLLFVALIITTATIAQESEKKENPETENKEEAKGSSKNVGSIELGLYFPIAFGDNFVNNGMDLKYGGRLSLKIDTYKGIYVGPYFSFFKGEVTDKELLGNYSKTNNYLIGGMIGYEKHINKFDLSLGIGVGHLSYSNEGNSISGFEDTGTAVWLNPEINYRFSNYLGIYFAPELRHDFMNIEVPTELEDTFKGVNYLNISFGLRISLGTAYKYM